MCVCVGSAVGHQTRPDQSHTRKDDHFNGNSFFLLFLEGWEAAVGKLISKEIAVGRKEGRGRWMGGETKSRLNFM